MGIHEAIAVELPTLSHLECGGCGNRIDLSGDDVARYLRDGWPVCCSGHAMTLVTMRQVIERRRVT